MSEFIGRAATAADKWCFGCVRVFGVSPPLDFAQPRIYGICVCVCKYLPHVMH